MPNNDKRASAKKILLWVLFIGYLLLLIKMVLLKFSYPVLVDIIIHKKNLPYSRVNLNPFSTIWFYYAKLGNIKSALRNLLGNVVIFLPLGIFLPALFKKYGFLLTSLTALLISLSFEYIQLLTGLGSFDVDDIILNVFGAIIGYACFKTTRT